MTFVNADRQPIGRPGDGALSPTVGRLERHEIKTASIGLAQAFDDSPLFTHLFPRARSRASVLRSFFAASIRDALAFEHVFVARAGDEILGTAVWLPPGTYPPTTIRQLKQLTGVIKIALLAPQSIARSLRYLGETDRAHPKTDHWYLAVLGVVPEAQGRGLGRALMVTVHDHADEVGSPTYLETDKEANLAFYARFRYELVETLYPDGPEAPETWTMWRDPVPPEPPG